MLYRTVPIDYRQIQTRKKSKLKKKGLSLFEIMSSLTNINYNDYNESLNVRCCIDHDKNISKYDDPRIENHCSK